jgi:hypothetical protein
MTYSFRSLTPTLQATADAAIEWFIKKWGLSTKQIAVEIAFDPDISFRPTFVVTTPDFHTLCIEVSESIYSNTLDSVVIHCRDKGLPVKLFVAVPKDVSDPQYGPKLKQAKRAGVGVLEVDHSSGTVIQQPIPLSLAGVRPIDLSAFPKKVRQNLQHAHQTFIDGEPAKACALVYDELESAFRKYAKKCEEKGLWPNSSNLKLDKAPWASIIVDVDKYLDRSKPITKKLTPALCARILGITTHRNESGHKPKSRKDLIKRDNTLRTRFENALDLFSEFLDAVRGARIF